VHARDQIEPGGVDIAPPGVEDRIVANMGGDGLAEDEHLVLDQIDGAMKSAFHRHRAGGQARPFMRG